jgi:GNAT superfamily N-acetyltransferase
MTASSPACRVAPATRDDIPALIQLMGEFYAESNFPLPEANARRAFESLLADPRLGGVWTARVDERPAGYVVLTLAFGMEYGGLRGFIDDLFVRPSARGHGVAAALLDVMTADCVARGVRSLNIEVGPDNDVAKRVYARAGFVDSERLLLARPLAPPLHE